MAEPLEPMPEDLQSALREIERLRRELERPAAEDKTGFLANVSHEIRTPMNAIKGLAELLGLTQLDNLQRSYVNGILSAAAGLTSIVDDILDFSQLDTGNLQLNKGPYDLAALLAEVSGLVGLRCDEKGLMFLVQAAPGMPASLWGDDVRIRQVLVSLLDNAVKYTAQGFVRLDMHTVADEAGLRLVCSVTDSGIGIQPQDQQNLFNAFTRAGEHAGGTVAGTGLGLAIARRLVLAMGGDITVQSAFGRGSTFSFWVPQQVVDPAPLAKLYTPGGVRVLLAGQQRQMNNVADMLQPLGAAWHTLPPGGPVPKDLPPFTHCICDESVPPKMLRQLHRHGKTALFAVLRSMQGALQVDEVEDTALFTPLLVTDLARFLNTCQKPPKGKAAPAAEVKPEAALMEFTAPAARLLVVDDNEVNLMVSSEMLRTFGATVDCANSGAAALEMCAQTPYDIIFMDHMMPEMDGIEVTSRLRGGKGPNRQTPIAALTANVANNLQSYYVRCGMDDYIGKPVALEDLARVLRRWLPAEKLQTA